MSLRPLSLNIHHTNGICQNMGTARNLPQQIDTNPRPSATQSKFAQEVIGTFRLYYACAVNKNTMLMPIGTIAMANIDGRQE